MAWGEVGGHQTQASWDPPGQVTWGALGPPAGSSWETSAEGVYQGLSRGHPLPGTKTPAAEQEQVCSTHLTAVQVVEAPT